MRIEFVASDAGKIPSGGAAAVMVFENGQKSAAAEAMDAAVSGALSRALSAAPRFAGKPGQTVELIAPSGVDVQRLIVIGAGAADAWGGDAAERFAAQAYGAVKLSGSTVLHVFTPEAKAEESARAALGAT
jgi:leucyl aminopeptidase